METNKEMNFGQSCWSR